MKKKTKKYYLKRNAKINKFINLYVFGWLVFLIIFLGGKIAEDYLAYEYLLLEQAESRPWVIYVPPAPKPAPSPVPAPNPAPHKHHGQSSQLDIRGDGQHSDAIWIDDITNYGLN